MNEVSRPSGGTTWPMGDWAWDSYTALSVWERTPTVHDSDGEGIGGSMTHQEGIVDCRRTMFPPTGDVVELLLLLPTNQFSALEVVAGRLDLTTCQLLRRTV